MNPETRTIRSAWSAAALGLVALAAAVLGGRAVQAQAGGAPAVQAASSVQHLVLATYHYDYQADPRKAVPLRQVRTKEGMSLLTDHPWESVGPWMSFDRAQWHKNQFQMMSAAGIDVALAVFRGDRKSRQDYAIKGLDVMVEGLKELRGEGVDSIIRPREYPQIGLALDLGGLAEQYGGPVSLKDPDVERSLFGMVREFYSRVPAEFRAAEQIPAEHAGGERGTRGYIVRLFGDRAVKDADAGALAAIAARFRKELGAGLIWAGTPALKAAGLALDAVAPEGAALEGPSLSREGWIRTGSIGPGYDDTAAASEPRIRPRENQQEFRIAFLRLLNSSPDWIFLDSWNGYAHGTDIAPSLEYGLLYRDLVRSGVLEYKGQEVDYGARFVRTTAPSIVQPQAVYNIQVTVENTGKVDWDAKSSAAVSYRWLKDGKPAGDPGPRISSAGQARGETRTYLMALTAPLDQGQALPPGEYELEFNMNRPVGKETVWFGDGATVPLRMPVTVGPAPAARPYWVESSMTTLAKRGATYPATVTLRNDGSDVWRPGSVSVGYRWRRVSTYLKGGSADADTVLGEGRPVPIAQDVERGRMISVDVPVSLTDAQGQPLPGWSPKEDWSYVLEWEVYAGGKPMSQSGGATLREVVDALDRDPGASFIGCNLSPQLVAGRTESVTVGLLNVGPEEWKKDRDKVAVHWYYLDGTEASWNDAALPLQADLPAFGLSKAEVPTKDALKLEQLLGQPAKRGSKKKAPPQKTRTETFTLPAVLRDVPVRVPYYFGPMYCVFDFVHDGVNASTEGASKGNDLLVIPVNVFSPTFTPIPLNAYYDVDGVSPDVARNDGNFDGRYNTYPSECLPPYVPRPTVGDSPGASPLYPSGLWVRPLNSIDNPRACFLYPGKNDATPNFAACAGQRLQFGGFQRNAVHVLAAATEEDAPGEFTLTYSDGTTETKKLLFTYWTDPPKHGEKVAFRAPHRHTQQGDDPDSSCYLNHYVVPAQPQKLLVGVELPKNKAIKVMAITLEAATLKVN